MGTCPSQVKAIQGEENTLLEDSEPPCTKPPEDIHILLGAFLYNLKGAGGHSLVLIGVR